MKKWFTVFCMALLMLAISGCGSDNALDSYSFGHKVIKSGNSEITVALPYDIGVQPNTTKNALGYPVTTYLGADKTSWFPLKPSPESGSTFADSSGLWC